VSGELSSSIGPTDILSFVSELLLPFENLGIKLLAEVFGLLDLALNGVLVLEKLAKHFGLGLVSFLVRFALGQSQILVELFFLGFEVFDQLTLKIRKKKLFTLKTFFSLDETVSF
jgi:hypothetical protein